MEIGGGGGGGSKRRQMGYLYTQCMAVVLIKGIHVLVTFSLLWGRKN